MTDTSVGGSRPSASQLTSVSVRMEFSGVRVPPDLQEGCWEVASQAPTPIQPQGFWLDFSEHSPY